MMDLLVFLTLGVLVASLFVLLRLMAGKGSWL